jgi:hypothetical protein
MHRVRMALSHFAEFGWDPVVLTVRPEDVEGVVEPLLLQSIPAGTPVVQVAALPARWTRKLGVGNLGIRAFPFLYAAGRRLLRTRRIDLVYFSTTMFVTMALGRLWKREFGVPFVLDMQDPWINEYVDKSPKELRPPKYQFVRHIHRVLEPWTMKKADGLIAVSPDYIDTLQRRYPRLKRSPAETIPFGADEKDLEIARANPQVNRFFRPGNGEIHGVYVGRAGFDMAPALRVIFSALREGVRQQPALFSKLRLHFIGTCYAADGRSTKSVEPLACEMDVGDYVREYPQRVPYFEALHLLLDADFLVVIGSDDPQYSASKIYPYVLANKPLVGALHERSKMWSVLRQISNAVIAFSPDRTPAEYTLELVEKWWQQLSPGGAKRQIDWRAFAPFHAREATRRQCEVFDRVVLAR